MRLTLVAMLVVGGVASCGDNSKQCGEGTNDNDGDNICEPDGEKELICGDGTVLDQLTFECVPSDTVCGNGTVLIDGQCKDPTGDLILDLEEGPEPNGFELGATPAGTITLKNIGEGFVLHGCIKPVDNTPDLDVFEFTVAGPTLLEVAADGVQGLAAGFITFGDAPQLAEWFRIGINVATDTSKRQLFLPVAGRYELVMADTRTLLPITQNGEGFPAAGNPDGTSCYFVTVTQRAIPTPATLDLVNGNVGTIGEELKFFTASFPTGFTSLVAVIDPEDLDGDGFPDFDALGNLIDSRAASSIVVMNNNQLRQIEDAGNGFPANTPISAAVFGGIKAGDNPLIVLDYVWNYTIGPANFEIEVDGASASQALSTSGDIVNATSNGKEFLGDNGGFAKTNQFHWDVTAANQVDGFDILFSIPMQGLIVDQDGVSAVPLTGLITNSNGTPTQHTFTSYKGLIRSLAPGRYYFFLFAPRSDVGTPFTVTSTIVPQVADAAVLDDASPLVFPVNAFNSNIVQYSASTEPWQLFSAEGTNTGNLLVELYDPNETTPRDPGFGFGRLDPFTTQLDNNPPSVKPGDGTPFSAFTFAADGSTASGRLLRNPISTTPPFPTTLLVKVNPAAPAASPTFSLDVVTRIYEDFGGPTITAPDTKTASGTITGSPGDRYYFETAPGNLVTITVTPSAGALDATLALLNVDESDRFVSEIGGAGVAESITFAQDPSGFVAFVVRGNAGTTGGYDISVQVAPSAYSIAASATQFDSACFGGVIVPLLADDQGLDPKDEGLSAPIAAPAGFTLFGAPVTSFVVSSNGFLSLNTALTSSLTNNTALPNPAADVDIAPYWDDLGEVVVCRKTIGNKLVIQWTGKDFSFPTEHTVQFQVILDPTDDSIEFVYGFAHKGDGSEATVGLQNAAGDAAIPIGFDQVVLAPGLALKLTPN